MKAFIDRSVRLFKHGQVCEKYCRFKEIYSMYLKEDVKNSVVEVSAFYAKEKTYGEFH